MPTPTFAEFTAGTYYIGDLCYVMSPEWDEVCKLTIKNHECLEGLFQLTDGRQFFLGHTRYGDGNYPDNLGNVYEVDAGLIGIISVSDISDSELENLTDGVVHIFNEPFPVSACDGLFNFGHIKMDTGYYDDVDDEDL